MKTLSYTLKVTAIFCGLLFTFEPCLAEQPNHPLPDANGVVMSISGGCGAFDIGKVDKRAYKRCTDIELAAYKKIVRLSEDKTIPNEVWNSCSVASSTRNVDFHLWAHCLDFAKSTCSLHKKYEGVGLLFGDGVTLDDKRNLVNVGDVIDGSPIQKAGIVQGDILMKIGEQEISGLTDEEIYRQVKGKAGTQLALTFFIKDSGQIKTVNLKRAQLMIPDKAGIQDCWIAIQSGKWIGRNY